MLERIGELHIFLPRQVLRELNRNLYLDEVKELFSLWGKYPEQIKISWDHAPVYLVEKYQKLGCKLGDAMVAAQIEQENIKFLISENRHFLDEIPGIPFHVLTSSAVLDEMNKSF